MDAIEQPEAVETPTPVESDAPPPVLSVTEHAKHFGPQATKAEPDPPAETAEQKQAREHHAAQQKRDRETGQFKEGKVRHRAASQQASPEDVPRIRELTARAKTAEERLAAAEAEVARLKAQHATPSQIATAEAKVEKAAAQTTSTFSEPEPKEDDPKYGGDYGKYLRDVSGWEGRKAYHDAKTSERQQTEAAEKEAARQASVKTWSTRVASARGKYDDFDAVAFSQTTIPEGSVVDRWIMEDETGPDVLYYLQSHRQELDTLLAKPVLQQVKDLALLSQRWVSTPSTQAGSTGSAAGRQVIVLPPRPPNPVRTEAQRAGDPPPPTDGSLSLTEHTKRFGPRR